MASKSDPPILLSGENPQITKGEGDAPVQAWIGAAPGWTHRLQGLVQPPPVETPAERLRIALELNETGLDLVRARLRREDPEASDASIEERLEAWLRDVPPLGAPGFSERS